VRAPVLALAIFTVLAGCAHAPAPAPTPPAEADACAAYERGTLLSPPTFSGANAFEHVLRQVCDFGHHPPRIQPRIPSTPGRDATAAYLASTLAGHGWTVTFQNFTGRDYDALPKGSVAGFASPGRCSDADRARMLNLTFANVVAERGQGGPLHILMAHYDTKRHASEDPTEPRVPVAGANDGASGVAVWLEASRLLVPAHGTLRILLVDGEDGFEDCHPLAGSIYHARHLSGADRDRLETVLLLDMVGDSQARFCLSGDDAALRERIRSAGQELGVSAVATANDCGLILDDHTAFMDAGFPALDLIDYRPGFPPYWHTADDTPDKLSVQMLEDVGRVVVRVVVGLTA
jgi:hypothetical protein